MGEGWERDGRGMWERDFRHEGDDTCKRVAFYWTCARTARAHWQTGLRTCVCVRSGTHGPLISRLEYSPPNMLCVFRPERTGADCGWASGPTTPTGCQFGPREACHQIAIAKRVAFWEKAVFSARAWSRVWPDSNLLDIGTRLPPHPARGLPSHPPAVSQARISVEPLVRSAGPLL